MKFRLRLKSDVILLQSEYTLILHTLYFAYIFDYRETCFLKSKSACYYNKKIYFMIKHTFKSTRSYVMNEQQKYVAVHLKEGDMRRKTSKPF